MPSRMKAALLLAAFASMAFLYYGMVYTQRINTQVDPRQWNKRMTAKVNHTNDGANVKTNGSRDIVPCRGHIQHASLNGTCARYIGEPPVCKSKNDTTMSPSCSKLRKPAGRKEIDVMLQTISNEKLDAAHGLDLESGGLYRPTDCSPSQRAAIVVPYRERPLHLKVFLNNIHPFLKKQKLEYMIFVIEQAPGSRLNRGMLRNIGFVEAEKICPFDCYFFHDIDMIPVVENNNYTCGDNPRHHASSLARWNHRLPDGRLFGGVVSFRKDHFKKINGYSNVYFGWGGEDDDLYNRVEHQGMKVDRYPMDVSKYADLKHVKSVKSRSRFTYLSSWKHRAHIDGLTSLKYKTYLIEFRKVYTWIYVGINETDILKQFPIRKENITISHKTQRQR